jgi:hypothetical protein
MNPVAAATTFVVFHFMPRAGVFSRMIPRKDIVTVNGVIVPAFHTEGKTRKG